MTTAEDFLAHHGVKGMKWGTRHDRGFEGQSAKTKVIAKADKKYEKSFGGINGFAKVNNALADKMNPRINAMNSKPEYKNGVDKNPALQKKYLKEYEGHVKKAIEETNRDFGSNASGTKKFSLTVVGKGYETSWVGNWSDVKHSGTDMGSVKIVPKFGKNGLILGQTITQLDPTLEHYEEVSDFLAHYGVPGMKWGRRAARGAGSGIARGARATGGAIKKGAKAYGNEVKAQRQSELNNRDRATYKQNLAGAKEARRNKQTMTRDQLTAQKKHNARVNLAVGVGLKLAPVVGSLGMAALGSAGLSVQNARNAKAGAQAARDLMGAIGSKPTAAMSFVDGRWKLA